MGKIYDQITPNLADWIRAQQMYFVSTAPLAPSGLVNCSPKGLDSFRILGPREVGYLDLTGSGIETVAHLKENGRIVFMFCAFTGPPRIVRLHGTGEVTEPGDEGFGELRARFPDLPGCRAVVRARVGRIADSCGFGVPRYEFLEQRDTMVLSAEKRGEPGLQEYRREKNSRSLDGLPGLDG